MKRTTFDIKNTENFSDKEKTKFFAAIAKAEDAINTVEFTRRVMAYKFDQTNGDDNYTILLKFMDGADKFNPEKDGDIDVYITMYYSRRRVVGYTKPSTYWTWINRKFFSGFNHASIGGNVAHEYCHNLGFNHNSAKDHDSVPYAIGYIVRDMILEKETYGKYLTSSTVVNPSTDTATTEIIKPKTSFWTKVALFFKRLF